LTEIFLPIIVFFAFLPIVIFIIIFYHIFLIIYRRLLRLAKTGRCSSRCWLLLSG
jgi:hypothetical protein